MKAPAWIRIAFLLSALYDGLLGLVFFLAPNWPFERFHVPPPNRIGYVQFPAALLMIFALMFFRIAADPRRYRELIPYGILLKLAYVSVSGWHWHYAGIPNMWKPFTVIDAVSVVLFLAAYAAVAKPQAERASK